MPAASIWRLFQPAVSRSRTQTWLSPVLFFVELVPDSTALQCFPCSVHSSRRCLQLATDRVLNGSTPTRVNATEASLDGRSFKICFLKPLASCSLTQCDHQSLETYTTLSSLLAAFIVWPHEAKFQWYGRFASRNAFKSIHGAAQHCAP